MSSKAERVKVQVYKSSELVLDAPAQKVWPFILDFSSFNDTFEKIEVIDGEANTVGALTRLTKRAGEWWRAPYLVKIVHLDPGRQIVWKMFPEKGDDFESFVDFSLHEDGSRTRFTIRLYKEHWVHAKSAQEIVDAKRAIIAASDKLEQQMMFPNLKRLAETAAN